LNSDHRPTVIGDRQLDNGERRRRAATVSAQASPDRSERVATCGGSGFAHTRAETRSPVAARRSTIPFSVENEIAGAQWPPVRRRHRWHGGYTSATNME
jgi:hypothetical protein